MLKGGGTWGGIFNNILESFAWQDPIIDEVDFTSAEPAGPSVGDRYISTGTGVGSETAQSVTTNYIYEWNGSDWTETVPVAGYLLFNDTDDLYRHFTGSAWANLSSVLRFPDGAVGAPSITFADDEDSGLYRIGDNNLGLTLGGTKYVDFSTSNTTYDHNIILNSGKKLGIGTDAPDDLLHIYNSDSGVTPHAYSAFNIESATHVAMNFLTPNDQTQYIMFGDPEDDNIGQITYNHATDELILKSNGINSFILNGNDGEIRGKFEISSAKLYGGGEITEVETVITTDATQTEVWTSPTVNDNETYLVEVKVIGMESDGSDRNSYHLEGLFYRNGGNVTQQGSTISLGTIESDADWDADFTLDTSNQEINIAVTGEAATTIRWKAVVTYQLLTAS